MDSPRVRTVFFGTAELACASLAALVAEPGLEVVAVVTQPDKPKGRELKLQPSPVKVAAERFALPVLQPEKARASEFLAALAAWKPDLVVVAAYGQILPQALLDLPRHGAVNVHTSLLPRYRGAAPIQWALLQGDDQTGVTIMKVDAGLDTGDILSQATTPIDDADDAQSLHDRLARLGAELLVRTIPAYLSGQIVPRPQPTEGVSYARKIAKEDGRLDWRQPAVRLRNRVRALTPWPGAFAFQRVEGQPRLLKIWKAEALPGAFTTPGTVLSADARGLAVSCGEGALRLLELQREGGRRLPAGPFLSGHPLPVGSILA